MPRNNVEESVPDATLKTSRVTDASPGALPANIRTSTIAAMMTISATVMPSIVSKVVVARRAGSTEEM
ncbi:MAG: hypothetical protein WKF83_11190 [Nocardioidaceae bacterium]